MHHKQLPLAGIKTSGLGDGEFIGYASTFGNVDLVGDRVMPGAFAKSIDAIGSGDVLPVLWEHVKNDPRMQVGEIKSARETDEGLEIHVALDLDTETGRAAYKSVKARRSKALSIGYSVIDQQKSAEGVNELKSLNLMEVSIVSSPANPAALIGEVKSTPALVKARKAAAELDGTDEPDEPETDESETWGDKVLRLLQEATDAAKELIDAAEADGRDLSEDEAEAVEKAHNRARGWKREAEAWAKKSPAERHGEMYAKARNAPGFDPEAFEATFGTSDAPAESLVKFDAPAFIKSRNTSRKENPVMETQTKYLTLGSGRKAVAATLAHKMQGGDTSMFEGGTHYGTKSLTSSGQVTTDTPMAPTVIPTGRPATSLMDVIPAIRRRTPQYSYLRQNSRALAADTVAEGAEKPVSAMGVETIEGNVSVVAHLTEELPKFVLGDTPALTRFVADEMLYGLDKGIEAQVLNGSGTAPDQRGILATSGVSVQAFDTTAIVSIRKAMTKAEALGYAPSVAILRPEDWEAIELTATSDDAVAFRGVPLDLLERRIWGLRVVLSTELPVKTGLVLDPSAVSIDTLGNVDVEWDTAGDLFKRNMVQGRVETRIGVSVYAPAAIYRVATAA